MGNSSCTKRRKRQQQHDAAKRTLTLHTFWNTKKSTEEIDEKSDNEVDDDDDEIEDCNWYNKVPTALENLELDIKKENVKNEVYVRLNSIRFYLQLIKYNN